MKRLLLTILMFFCLSAVLNASAQTPEEMPVWFASGKQIYRIDPRDNSAAVMQRASVVGDLVTDVDGSVWAILDHSLVRLDSMGNAAIPLDLTALGLKTDPMLALDGHSGGLWLGTETSLVKLGADGQTTGAFKVAEVFGNTFNSLRQMQVGLDQTLWVLANKQLGTIANGLRKRAPGSGLVF